MRNSLRRLASDEGWRERRIGDWRRVRIELLDGEHIYIDINRKAKGSDLLDKVCENLDVIEQDYFGLLHAQRGDPRVWVDMNRRLSKTFKSIFGSQTPPKGSRWGPAGAREFYCSCSKLSLATHTLAIVHCVRIDEPWDVKFAVKFYPPEPSELNDDATRNQLVLAVRRDLLEGRLTCSTITYALLASYSLQAELGDYEPGRVSTALLADEGPIPLRVISPEMENKVEELYRKHKGQTPAEAELNYLESAKKLTLYGAELHCARDCDLVDIVLAVTAAGIAVHRDGQLMNRFPWAKITKISYNKRTYTLRLRASEFDEFETHLIFRLASTTAAKKLWRCSVEHHIFFRREIPVKVERITGFPRLGSRRVSCRRTLCQLRTQTLCNGQTPLVA